MHRATPRDPYSKWTEELPAACGSSHARCFLEPLEKSSLFDLTQGEIPLPQEEEEPPRKTTEADLRKARPIMKIMSRVNTWIFRLTRGAVGSRFPGSGAPVGLLVYTGRKTGQSRTVPLVYGLDGQRVILIASQGGMPKHPIWYHSLIVNPEVIF